MRIRDALSHSLLGPLLCLAWSRGSRRDSDTALGMQRAIRWIMQLISVSNTSYPSNNPVRYLPKLCLVVVRPLKMSKETMALADDGI